MTNEQTVKSFPCSFLVFCLQAKLKANTQTRACVQHLATLKRSRCLGHWQRAILRKRVLDHLYDTVRHSLESATKVRILRVWCKAFDRQKAINATIENFQSRLRLRWLRDVHAEWVSQRRRSSKYASLSARLRDTVALSIKAATWKVWKSANDEQIAHRSAQQSSSSSSSSSSDCRIVLYRALEFILFRQADAWRAKTTRRSFLAELRSMSFVLKSLRERFHTLRRRQSGSTQWRAWHTWMQVVKVVENKTFRFFNID